MNRQYDNNQQQPVVIPPPESSQRDRANQLMGYQFSPEELKVLQQCNRDSLFQRSLPLGTTFGLAVWYAIKQGMLQPGIKFASGPKVLAGITVGYFIGKLSYQTVCAEKLMTLPNSKLGEMLRQKKKGGLYESLTPDGSLTMSPFGSSTDHYTDEAFKPKDNTSSLNLDVTRPDNFGLDDTYRPSLDMPNQGFEDTLLLDPPKNSSSYEELRRKNREEYEKKQANPFNRPIVREESPIVIRQPERAEPQLPGGQKNKYGDSWTG